MKPITLTKSEKEIMDLLWNTDRPLTATEIVNLTPERTWKKSYIHLLINSLLDKGVIQTAAMARTGRNFGRTFSAAMSRESFMIFQITTAAAFSQNSVPLYVQALVDAVDDLEVLKTIEEIVSKRINEIKKEDNA